MAELIVFSKEYDERSKKLADSLSIEYLYETSNNHDLYLEYIDDSLNLVSLTQRMTGDFSTLSKRLKIHNLNTEFLVKAAKIKGICNNKLTIVDATAGMGEDSLILAAAGFNVKLFESDPYIFALLNDTVLRFKDNELFSDAISRMELYNEDSINVLINNKDIQPDIVLLDPMFPERKKSGLIKKKFQLLQQLEKPCSNEEELLNAAIKSNPKKIIIKRPLKGPYLAGYKPSYSINGKAIRYDCIIL